MEKAAEFYRIQLPTARHFKIDGALALIDYFLRCRIFARMRRFFRPIFRRPFPVFFDPTECLRFGRLQNPKLTRRRCERPHPPREP